MTKRYTERQLQRRANILNAARELIAERGYEGVTMRDLAERSGVALKTLYSQYTDKETLLRSAVEEAHRATYHEIQAMAFDSGLEKLLHVANIVAKNILENETYAKSLAPIMARGVTSTEFGDVRSQVYRSAVQQIAEDGDLDPRLDVDHITRLLLRQIAAIYYEWARGEISTNEVGTVLRLQMVISLAGLASGETRRIAEEEVPELMGQLPPGEGLPSA